MKKTRPTYAQPNDAAKKVLAQIANSPASQMAKKSVMAMFKRTSRKGKLK